MIMADVLKIVLLILATLLVFQAHWIASYALFPKQVERCRELYGRPIMLTFLGLVSIGPLILLGVFLAQKADKNPAIQLFSLVRSEFQRSWPCSVQPDWRPVSGRGWLLIWTKPRRGEERCGVVSF